jgi:mannose-6-phosphate isomerase
VKLDRRYVEKPWGRTHLPSIFDAPAGKRIGEVWFTSGSELPLLAKYIFTSERLSIQVHPNDEQARTRGLRQGKSECWYILDADPDSVLGLGLTREVAKDELRQAALDGSIEQLIDWRPVAVGDFIFVPAGTVHAIGAGVSLLEFQQNSDVTYRLYDYGRPRELHLDEGIAVADPRPFGDGLIQHLSDDSERLLVDGPHFRLAYRRRDAFVDRRRWVIPIAGEARANGETAAAGDCLLVKPGEQIEVESARLLIGTTA